MENNMTQKQALMELLKRIKKYWHLLIGSLLFALVYVVLSLYVPKLIGLGTDKIVSKGNVDFQGLERIAVQIAVIAAIAGIAQWIMGLLNNSARGIFRLAGGQPPRWDSPCHHRPPDVQTAGKNR